MVGRPDRGAWGGCQRLLQAGSWSRTMHGASGGGGVDTRGGWGRDMKGIFFCALPQWRGDQKREGQGGLQSPRPPKATREELTHDNGKEQIVSVVRTRSARHARSIPACRPHRLPGARRRPILAAAVSSHTQRPTRQYVRHTGRAATDASSHGTNGRDGRGWAARGGAGLKARVYMQTERNRDGGDSGGRGDGRK